MILHCLPGRPTNLGENRARADCAFSGADGCCLDIFLSFIISLFFLPPSGIRLDIDCNAV